MTVFMILTVVAFIGGVCMTFKVGEDDVDR